MAWFDRPPPPLISLEAPRGEVHATPELFAWQPVDGAASYRVTIGDADTVWPLVVATTTDARFPLPPGKRGAILPGRIHEWTVEALDARGALIGSGTVRFWVGRGAPARRRTRPVKQYARTVAPIREGLAPGMARRTPPSAVQ